MGPEQPGPDAPGSRLGCEAARSAVGRTTDHHGTPRGEKGHCVPLPRRNTVLVVLCCCAGLLTLFRPGSRAWLVTFHGNPDTDVSTMSSTSTSTTYKHYQVKHLRGSHILQCIGCLPAEDDIGRQLADEPPKHIVSVKGLLWLNRCMLAIALVNAIYCMMPAPAPAQGGRGSDFNYRIPPSWGPEDEHHYSFRAYMTDISL